MLEIKGNKTSVYLPAAFYVVCSPMQFEFTDILISWSIHGYKRAN